MTSPHAHRQHAGIIQRFVLFLRRLHLKCSFKERGSISPSRVFRSAPQIQLAASLRVVYEFNSFPVGLRLAQARFNLFSRFHPITLIYLGARLLEDFSRKNYEKKTDALGATKSWRRGTTKWTFRSTQLCHQEVARRNRE